MAKHHSLSRQQVVELCRKAELGAYTADLAEVYKLTINQAIGILRSNNLGHHYRYRIYGRREYNWINKDGSLADGGKRLKELMSEGWNDDQIAQFMETTQAAITRARSHCGFVAFNRTVLKGAKMRSEDEVKHGVVIEGAEEAMKLNDEESLRLGRMILEGTESVGMAQRIIEKNKGWLNRRSTTTEDGRNLTPIAKYINDSQVVKELREENMRLKKEKAESNKLILDMYELIGKYIKTNIG